MPQWMHFSLSTTGRMDRQSPVLYRQAFPGSDITQPTGSSLQVGSSIFFLGKARSFPYVIHQNPYSTQGDDYNPEKIIVSE
jgi:hypothetical protein